MPACGRACVFVRACARVCVCELFVVVCCCCFSSFFFFFFCVCVGGGGGGRGKTGHSGLSFRPSSVHFRHIATLSHSL